MQNTPTPTAPRMPFVYNDGGRLKALGPQPCVNLELRKPSHKQVAEALSLSAFNNLCNRKEVASDCVARAIAIASGRPYAEVWLALAQGQAQQRATKRTPKQACTADKGINTTRRWFAEYMRSLGFVSVATMGIGTGCKVHLRPGELPMGRLVVNVSKHFTAVIDGVIHDNHNPDRFGTRCVYSYWVLQEGRAAL